MAVKIRRITSADQAKQIVAKGANSGAFIRLRDKQTIRIRFMGEPGEDGMWVQFTEHYDQTNGYFPCTDDGTCPGCEEGIRAQKRMLVQVLDMAEKTVVALIVPTTLAEELLTKFDKFHTLCDRTYELSRHGATMNDTRYSVDYGEVKRLDLSRFEPIDLEALINTQLPPSDAVVDPDEELEEQRSAPRQGQRAGARPNMRASLGRRSTVDDDLDDDGFAPAPKTGTVKAVAKKAAATPPPTKRLAPVPAKKLLRRP